MVAGWSSSTTPARSTPSRLASTTTAKWSASTRPPTGASTASAGSAAGLSPSTSPAHPGPRWSTSTTAARSSAPPAMPSPAPPTGSCWTAGGSSPSAPRRPAHHPLRPQQPRPDRGLHVGSHQHRPPGRSPRVPAGQRRQGTIHADRRPWRTQKHRLRPQRRRRDRRPVRKHCGSAKPASPRSDLADGSHGLTTGGPLTRAAHRRRRHTQGARQARACLSNPDRSEPTAAANTQETEPTLPHV